MNIQQFKIFIKIILFIIGNISLSSTFLIGDIIVPPKLSDKTTPAVRVPTMLPQDLRQTTDASGSIEKRSTANLPLVPPTIRSKDGQPPPIHLNLMVPPTISSAEKGTGNSGGSLSPQVTGVLNSKPRVVCYADRPIEQDVPCPTANHSSVLGVQHMQGLLKMLGGSDTVRLNTAAPASFSNIENHSNNDMIKSEEKGKLKEIILEISLGINQRFLAAKMRYKYDNLQAMTNEITTVTDSLFKCLFPISTENFITSIFANTNGTRASNVEGIKAKDWQTILVSNTTIEDFIAGIGFLNRSIEKTRHFYQAFLNISKTHADYKSLISTIDQEVDVDALQIVYDNIKSAISNLKTMFTLVEQAVVNTTDEYRSKHSGDGTRELLVDLNYYVKSVQLFENIRSDPKQNLSNFETLMSVSNNTETILIGVIHFLKSRTNVLEQLLDEFNIEISEHKRNMEKLRKMKLTSKRKRRDIIGASDMTCQNQGERIGGGNLLNLCSTCVQTSVLSGEFFPRYLTEKICQPDSLTAPLGPRSSQQGCLFQPGLGGAKVASGVCREQYFHINILKRVPGKCMKVQLDGKEVITDQWELTMHPLRVGCECAVDENSKFAQFVDKN